MKAADAVRPMPPTRVRCAVAVDIRAGAVVGRPDTDPEEVLARLSNDLEACVVDLDRSVGESSSLDLLVRLVAAMPGRLTVGGGVVNAETVNTLLRAGAARVVLGSQFVAEALARPSVGANVLAGPDPRQLRISLDVLTNRLVRDGFTLPTRWSADAGAQRILGMLRPGTSVLHVSVDASRARRGPSPEGACRLRRQHPGLDHWYAGDVRSWRDVTRLNALGLGVVVGRHYLTGQLGLPETEEKT